MTQKIEEVVGVPKNVSSDRFQLRTVVKQTREHKVREILNGFVEVAKLVTQDMCSIVLLSTLSACMFSTVVAIIESKP